MRAVDLAPPAIEAPPALAENERLKQRVEAGNVYLLNKPKTSSNCSEIVGRGPAIERVLHMIELVAPTGANVLISGESGTGKELIARAIHDLSPRCKRAFIKVNCAAIPQALFESEFFGHVRGAFTGANADCAGRFELANGGTLFLDEIGELPMNLQSKLLGVLQEGQFERVGEGKSRSVDVRVIAATNRDLEAEIGERHFRKDLYYRLNIFPIRVPPLRTRMEDIPPLAEHLLRMASRRLKRTDLRLTREHIRQLLAYDWPGNVREMQNIIERAVILARGDQGLRFDIPSGSAAAVRTSVARDEAQILDERARWERDYRNLAMALERANGKIAGPKGAAALLGVKPTTLRSRLKAFGISLQPAVVFVRGEGQTMRAKESIE